jgi:hypothetical protein
MAEVSDVEVDVVAVASTCAVVCPTQSAPPANAAAIASTLPFNNAR